MIERIELHDPPGTVLIEGDGQRIVEVTGSESAIIRDP